MPMSIGPFWPFSSQIRFPRANTHPCHPERSEGSSIQAMDPSRKPLSDSGSRMTRDNDYVEVIIRISYYSRMC